MLGNNVNKNRYYEKVYQNEFMEINKHEDGMWPY